MLLRRRFCVKGRHNALTNITREDFIARIGIVTTIILIHNIPDLVENIYGIENLNTSVLQAAYFCQQLRITLYCWFFEKTTVVKRDLLLICAELPLGRIVLVWLDELKIWNFPGRQQMIHRQR